MLLSHLNQILYSENDCFVTFIYDHHHHHQIFSHQTLILVCIVVLETDKSNVVDIPAKAKLKLIIINEEVWQAYPQIRHEKRFVELTPK